MQPFDLASLKRLSVDERPALIEAVWESIDAENDPPPITEEQRAELDGRIADMERNPNDGEDWEVVRARLQSR
jgi:putative addiction module component (TIGR02574 family)